MLQVIPKAMVEELKEHDPNKILQALYRVRDEDVSHLSKLDNKKKIKRICARLGTFRKMVNLKSKDSACIAAALFEVVHRYKKHKGFSESDAKELAEIVTQREDISNPSKLFSVYRGSENYVVKGLEEFRYDFLWQTDDGFPTLVNADLQEDGVEIMNAIYYRVLAKPSKAHWKKRTDEYKEKLMENMNSEYEKETPKLPVWFQNEHRPMLEEKLSTFQRKLKDQKKIAKPHTCPKGCSKCIIPSNCSNIVYFWSVFLGKDFSHQLNHRSYVGIAATCKERWNSHFQEANAYIDHLFSSHVVPEEVIKIQRVELVLALAIAADYDSVLYCLDMFDNSADARKCEKQINTDLELTKLSKGLNKYK